MSHDAAYRVEQLRRRLAQGETAELGLRIEADATVVTVSGTVADEECRDAIRRAAAEELGDLTLRMDLVVSTPDPPAWAERL